ncbi:MAG: hypothetical protein DMG49_09355 [Acidobacteria bacterium]|nr:MAG: hypothetical protein DMG49_09355 [Acidobacteriota bacterium]
MTVRRLTGSTTAYLSYDDKNLYTVFVCHDEAGQVRAHLSKGEASDQDDDGVGVLLDTFRDFNRAYFFYSNPPGVQIYYRLGTRAGWTTPPFSPGRSIFNNYLNRAKLNYQFTKELSLRLILDYNATIANTNLLDLQTNLGSYDGGPMAPTKQLRPMCF